MYAVFARFDQDTRQRAYDLFTSLPLAPEFMQPFSNPVAYRLASWRDGLIPGAMVCPIGACNAILLGHDAARGNLLVHPAADDYTASFVRDYDQGKVVDLADAMGVLV